MKFLQCLRLIVFGICLCLITALFILLFLGRLYPRDLGVQKVGEPIVINEVIRNNYLGINQIISKEDRIYIMHANYGVVSVYNSTGVYQYTISVYSHANGRMKIALKDGLLYVRDKQGNVYRFQENVFLDFVPKSQSGILVQSIDFDVQSREYVLKATSIYRSTSNGTFECIISRPLWLLFAEARVAKPLLFALMIFCFICVKLPVKKLHRNKTGDGSVCLGHK